MTHFYNPDKIYICQRLCTDNKAIRLSQSEPPVNVCPTFVQGVVEEQETFLTIVSSLV